jgi:hypothetical protein
MLGCESTEDIEKVKGVQADYGLQPLSAFLGTAPPAAAPQPDFHEWAEGSQFDDRYLLNSTNVDEGVLGEDGSLVFHISKESPGKDLDRLWESRSMVCRILNRSGGRQTQHVLLLRLEDPRGRGQ